MPANRDNTGKFVKGKSGNPSGRPKTPDAFKDIVKDKSTSAITRVIEIMEDPESKPQDVMQAAKIVIEYAYGKPAQDISNTLKMGEMGDFTLVIKGNED